MIKLKETDKIELWCVTAVISIALIFSVTYAINNINAGQFYDERFWLRLFFNYLITCICYLLLFFYVGTELNKENGRPSNVMYFIYLLIAICTFMGIINVYFAMLLSIKIFIIYLTSNKQNEDNQLNRELTLLFASWLFILSTASLLNSSNILKALLVFIAPIAILHYLYSIYVILPRIMQKRRRFMKYLGNCILLTLLSFIPLGLMLCALFYENQGLVLLNTYSNENTAEIVLAFNAPVQLLLVPLFAWNIYKVRNEKKTEEIMELKTELGKSDASLNFLKSQINPHFLFNALNTLYGTALQENAERTGEGIQKLGDMMRFMLQENMEDKILLSRDVDYLNNYIALQKLRTSTSYDVTIETQIEEQIGKLQISPMLLIPFVENAFKHGISLINPSYIKITLQTADHILYFDVHNTIHDKKDSDPEKSQSGIGLQNVKQRLALLYPKKHELIIRESAREFFIHLTINLNTNS